MFRLFVTLAVNRMNSAYTKLKEIWNNCSENNTSSLARIVSLLSEFRIRLRQRDGTLKQITLSIPTSKENSYVVGLRYIKDDGTFTEDHFLCEKEGVGLKGEEIVHHPKRKLDFVLPEYKGTHKEIPDLNAVNNITTITDVSTYSYVEKNGKNS